jgi:quinohemoprotein ethanol dehydrogenase
VQTASEDRIRYGEIKFIQECSRCHVLGPSSTPDLRRLDPGLQAIFKDVVLRGAVAPTGMERFDDILSESDVEAIHAYLIDEAWKAYKAQQAAPSQH